MTSLYPKKSVSAGPGTPKKNSSVASAYPVKPRSLSISHSHPAEMAHCDFVVKIILLGDVGVGKTTLFHSFLQGSSQPKDKLSAMTRITGNKVVMHQDKKVMVILCDTGGQERYRSLTTSYYRGAHACLLMYDVNRLESLTNIATWLEDMQDYGVKKENIVSILVGTSRQTKPSRGDSSDPVNPQSAQNFAAHHQMPHYMHIDCVQDLKALNFLMDTLVTLVINKAMSDRQLLLSVRPPTPSSSTVLNDKKSECRKLRLKCCCV